MYMSDAQELERKLDFFSRGEEERMTITRIEAKFIADCINGTLRRAKEWKP